MAGDAALDPLPLLAAAFEPNAEDEPPNLLPFSFASLSAILNPAVVGDEEFDPKSEEKASPLPVDLGRLTALGVGAGVVLGGYWDVVVGATNGEEERDKFGEEVE